MSGSSSPAEAKPPHRLQVEVAGEDRVLFMSFGLLNEVAALAGGPEGVPSFSFNSDTTMALLKILLAKRDARGAIVAPEGEDPAPVVPFALLPESAEQMIDWAGAHALDFFVRRFGKSAELFASKATSLAAVGSSLTSSGN